MPVIEITAKITKGEHAGKATTCKVDIPDDPEEFIKKYTLPVTVSNARGQLIVSYQDVMRSGIKAGKGPADIQKDVTAYKPGLKKKGKTKAEKLAEKFAGLSAEEKKSLLKRLA